MTHSIVRQIVFIALLLGLTSCVKRPSYGELVAESARWKEEAQKLRQEALKLALQYKACRGQFLNPDSPVGKDK